MTNPKPEYIYRIIYPNGLDRYILCDEVKQQQGALIFGLAGEVVAFIYPPPGMNAFLINPMDNNLPMHAVANPDKVWQLVNRWRSGPSGEQSMDKEPET